MNTTKAEKLLSLVKAIPTLNLSYNTVFFLFFLMLFLGIYFLLKPNVLKKTWILTGNIIFYAWAGPSALAVVLFTALIVYAAANIMQRIYDSFQPEGMSPKEAMEAFKPYKKRARVWLWMALLIVAALWVAVKVCRLAGMASVDTFADLLQRNGIIVPLGISYYTLCLYAYLMDVYWKKTKAEKNFLDFVTVVTYFPHIVQGPFCRYQKHLKQLQNLPGFQYERVCFGLQLMLWGYFKKLVVADRLSVYTGTIFGNISEYAGVEIFHAVLLATIQLYADFSGCMDIVSGISSCIGIELPVNFNRPFFATNAAEFWRRWHITLGEWTKEYIYLPIAMNPKFMKKGRKIKTEKGNLLGKIYTSFFPLFAVWIFTGIWHGTGWDYMCWGLYWGLIIIVSQIVEDYYPKVRSALHIDAEKTYYRIFMMIRTFLIFALGRTFTLVGGLQGFALLWERMFAEHRLWVILGNRTQYYGLDRQDLTVAVIGVAIMLFVDYLHEKQVKIRETLARQPLVVRWPVYMAAIFSVVILGMYGVAFDAAAFVYGNF